MSEPVPAVEYQDEEDEAVRGVWAPKSEVDLEFCLRRLGECQAEIAKHKEAYNAEVTRLEMRLEQLNAKAQRGATFFQSVLHNYVQAHRGELLTGKKKSRDFLHGRVGFRANGGGLEVVDKEALLAWVRQQPVELGFLRITEAPALDEIKRHFKACGEVPPGTDVKPEGEKFYCEPIQEKSNGQH